MEKDMRSPFFRIAPHLCSFPSLRLPGFHWPRKETIPNLRKWHRPGSTWPRRSRRKRGATTNCEPNGWRRRWRPRLTSRRPSGIRPAYALVDEWLTLAEAEREAADDPRLAEYRQLRLRPRIRRCCETWPAGVPGPAGTIGRGCTTRNFCAQRHERRRAARSDQESRPALCERELDFRRRAGAPSGRSQGGRPGAAQVAAPDPALAASDRWR